MRDKIQQLIDDIKLNEWYCDIGFGESSLLDWEKSLIIEGLKGLSTKEINKEWEEK